MPIWLDMFVGIATAAGTVAVAVVAWIQLSKIGTQFRLQGQRERNWKTLEVCRTFDLDPVVHECARALFARWNEQKCCYENIEEANFEAVTLLNLLDEIAIGIHQGIYDEKVAFDHIRSYVEKAVVKIILPNGKLFQKVNYEYLISLHNQWANQPPPQPTYIDPEAIRNHP